jgi:hydroxymethylglutaryl-CoA synthase
MIGIISHGVHIPYLRLKRDDIAGTWETPSQGGERAVANYDEDSITMAVSAATTCLNNIDRNTIGGLFLATTTSPYSEKQASSLIATALDLPRQVLAADVTGTTRAGTIALRLAADTVRAGTASNILVIAADCRTGAPGSDFEQNLGDSAAALLIGESNVKATLEDSYTHYDEINDIWRTAGDRFLNSWEDRFIVSEGYAHNIVEAARGLMANNHLKPEDISRAVLYAPDRRNHSGVIHQLRFSPDQAQNHMPDTLGNTGNASVFLTLAAALEESRPGDRILLGNYGSGADAFLMKITDNIEESRERAGVQQQMATKRLLPHYGKYLRLREIIGVETAHRRPPELSSPTVLWRDRRMTLALIGQRCRHCGKIQYPRQRVCITCSSKDQFDDIKLADKKAKIFTFSLDNLASVVDPPLIKTVVDFEGGGRISCLMTDCDPGEVAIGMEVEMTFRKIHDAMGYPNYWWKCRPVRR